MEKYDNIVKIEEIKKLMENNDYKQAGHIVKSMDISQITATNDLSTIAEVLSKDQRYDEALEVLTRIYDKGKNRKVVFQLLEVAIKSENLVLAENYYREYIELAPQDSTRYIFQYLIMKLDNRPINEQVEPLKELKKYEYKEEWIYELATLYHKEGMKEECIEECNDLIVWFGSGDYVNRAKLLKGYYEGKIDLFDLIQETEKGNQAEEKEAVQTPEEKEAVQTPEEKEAVQTPEEKDSLDEYLKDRKINYNEIFGKNLDNKEIKQQLIKNLSGINKNEITYFNLVISGVNKAVSEEKTTFSKGMLKVLYQLGHITNKKMGIIDSETFNNMDSDKAKDTLRGCSLIIDKAAQLKDDKLDDIEKWILDKEQNIIIVLQDEGEGINKLFQNHPNLNQYFNITIKI